MEKNSKDLSGLEELLLKFPGLNYSTDREVLCLKGPINIRGLWLNFILWCPCYPQLEGWTMKIQQGCNFNTISYRNAKVNISWTISNLLQNIPELLENLGYKKEITSPKLDQNIYAEIADIYSPSEYEVRVNDSCSRIRFCNFAQHEQPHYLEVEVQPYLKILDHSLPTCIHCHELLGKSSTLAALLHQYRTLLDDLRLFYENFTDIDELCHVVQPALPTTKENWRLFVLKDRTFLKLQFSDPFAPLSSMAVHIIGPTTEVTNLRRIYSEGICDWDAELDVHKNLLRIFDLCFFPMPLSEGAESNLQYCNICYSYKLDKGEIPIISCDNSHCNLIFHAECLKEWFNTLADGKTFLDVSFGACPFCKSKLSTSFHELLQLK